MSLAPPVSLRPPPQKKQEQKIHFHLGLKIWNNRKRGTAEWGTPRGMGYPSGTASKHNAARIDTYLRCIQTGLDTHQDALFL